MKKGIQWFIVEIRVVWATLIFADRGVIGKRVKRGKGYEKPG